MARLATRQEKYIVLIIAAIASVALVGAVAFASSSFLVTTPVPGGNFTEGILGVPRFINPLLSTSDPDRDLVTLVYSGLTRPMPSESFRPDLASSYSISEDGLTYTFTIKEGLTWHDNVAITSNDVAFTVRLIQDERIRSPRRANWEGVRLETPDDRTVIFKLKQPYAPFLENTTIGILPEHVWRNVSPEEFALSINNIRAIGSGPYRIEKVETDGNGIPKQVKLRSFHDFALGEPYIEEIFLRFYGEERALIEAHKK